MVDIIYRKAYEGSGIPDWNFVYQFIPDNQRLVLLTDGIDMAVGYWSFEKHDFIDKSNAITYSITAWLELPPIPFRADTKYRERLYKESTK